MNVVICMTPLQVLIANEVIKKQKDKDFIFFYLSYSDNIKNRYYYDILRRKCRFSFFIHLKNKTFMGKVETVLMVRKNVSMLGSIDVDSVFLANIDLLIVQYLISKIKFKSIFSFDDGTANILKNSYFFTQREQSPLKVFIKNLLGIKFKDIYTIKKLLSLHYTIYPNEKNIIKNTRAVDIFPEFEATTNLKPSSVKKILLGQPLEGLIGEDKYRKIILKMHDLLNIDYYFPHPRETLGFDDMLTVIESNLIIEDYLIRELQDSNVRFEVYTFFSSAILSLNNSESIDVIIVSDALLMEIFSEAYQFFIDRGFKLIDLELLT